MGQNQNGSDDDWLSSDIEKFEYDLDGIRISLIFETYARQKWYKKNTKQMNCDLCDRRIKMLWCNLGYSGTIKPLLDEWIIGKTSNLSWIINKKQTDEEVNK